MSVRNVALRLGAALLALVAVVAVHGAFCQAVGGSHATGHTVGHALPGPAQTDDGASADVAGAASVDRSGSVTGAPSVAATGAAAAALVGICLVVLLAAAGVRRSAGLLRRIRPGPPVSGQACRPVRRTSGSALLPAPSLSALCVLRV